MEKKKTILLISPQPWGDLFISKHHYAIELEQSGYEVYFLNPPVKKNKIIVESARPLDNKSLLIVNSSFPNHLFLRYHVAIIYSFFVKKWVQKILKRLPAIDIVWCFETNIFRDLSIFGNIRKIFHVVDPMNEKLVDISKTADLTVCISNRILKQFDSVPGKKVFINHGLSDIAIQKARNIDFDKYLIPDRLSVGYVGNLSLELIDTKNIHAIVKDNPLIDFHFWGPGRESNLGGETLILVESLQHEDNVIFHSSIPSVDLIDTIQGMDIFLLAYNNMKGVYDGSNSHKILEYLATGKVVAATYIDQYKGSEFENFLQLSPDGKNEELVSVFKHVAANIAFWNTKDKMQMRRDYACGQSYRSNAKKILQLIGE